MRWLWLAIPLALGASACEGLAGYRTTVTKETGTPVHDGGLTDGESLWDGETVDGAQHGDGVDATVAIDSVADSGVDTLAPDSTVDTLAPDSTVDTLAPDSSIDTLAPDSTVDTLAPDSSIDTLAPDSSIDTLAPDTTVDTLAPDTTVDTLAPDTTYDTLVDAGVDGPLPDAAPPPPTVLFNHTIGSNSDETTYAVAMDDQDHVYVTGSFTRDLQLVSTNLPNAGSADIFVAHFDETGQLVWVRGYGGVNADEGTSIAVDSAGNVYVGGYVGSAVDFGGSLSPAAGSHDGIVLSLDAAGSVRWLTPIAGSGSDVVWGLATGGGIVGAVGQVGNGIDLGQGPQVTNGALDGFVARLDTTTGTLLDGGLISGDGDSDRSLAVAVDPQGNLYAGATFLGDVVTYGRGATSAGGYDGLIIALDAAGAWRWGIPLSSVIHTEVTALALEGATLYVAGKNTNPPIDGSGFIRTLSANDGSEGWRLGLVATTTAIPWGICARNGLVHAAGDFEKDVEWAGTSHDSVGQTDILWARASAAGVAQPLITVGSNRAETAYGVACSASGRVAMVGTLQGTLDFGLGPVPYAGGDDGFLVVFSP